MSRMELDARLQGSWVQGLLLGFFFFWFWLIRKNCQKDFSGSPCLYDGHCLDKHRQVAGSMSQAPSRQPSEGVFAANTGHTACCGRAGWLYRLWGMRGSERGFSKMAAAV